MNPLRSIAAAISAGLLFSACTLDPASARQDHDPYDTGGTLMPEQAAYDVSYYDLAVRVNPADSTVDGTVRVVAGVHSPIDWFVLDLVPTLDVHGITLGEHALAHERRGGRLWIKLPTTRQPGSTVDLTVAYGGRPRVAPRPPWQGGIQWNRTPSGAPWIATSCQGEGADIWWPVKDHVSDEPDSMGIRITVPEGLVAASNGRFVSSEPAAPGWTTWNWHVSTSINTYNVALNIAPYVRLDSSWVSVAGDTVPVHFWVLPENEADGRRLLPEIVDQMRWFETVVGPYPFRADKYGVAQTPHLGMEHQSIIAYGANFRNESMTRGTDWGFDALHQHEAAHEWWGNLLTNVDWADMWLHEGFGSYMQPLYSEHLAGPGRYLEHMRSQRRGIGNQKAVAPRGSLSGDEIYNGHDIYAKGSWILHSLRYLLGDETFFTVLRRQAYPDPAMEAVTDGRQTRFGTTDDFLALAEQHSGRELDWFFEVYLRQPELPELETRLEGDRLTLRWKVPGDLPFPMPIDLRVGDAVERIDLSKGPVEVRIPEGLAWEIDPDDRVLRVGNRTP